ncbi:MAG: DUF5597 domain-containing protein [Saccharofermentanales bacterium]|nr:DUF5597 domain-containing protein [Clostridiaceae bacterium]
MKLLPKLEMNNGLATLYVDGKPFFALGGELHNSSASSTAYMREVVWPGLRQIDGLNSVIATVSWQQIEPGRGRFDFTVLDDLIADARQEGIRLVLIWFGLWKNGASSYVPSWVKRDPVTYFPCVRGQGTQLGSRFGDRDSYTISPLCDAAVAADARAFAAVMAHIRDVDTDHTVIMMQVENEIGLLGSARDYSPVANAKYPEPIPQVVAEAYGVSGSWEQAFGDDAQEYFMAWYYARAVQTIATAGIQELALPMYVNAWLQQDPDRAGAYPSGGPIAKMIKLWRLAAPSICLYAPDIYLPDFEAVVAEYSADGNSLFIPEARTNVSSAAAVFLAFGKYNAIGFNPFGIEDLFAPRSGGFDPAELAALNIDVSAFSNEGTAAYLPRSYCLISNMLGTIARYRGTKQMTGFYQYGDAEGCMLSFSKYDIRIAYGRTSPGKPPAGGLVIEVDADNFIFAGTNFLALFLPKKGIEKHVGYVMIQEGEYQDDVWRPGRILNGDEQRVGLRDVPQALQVEVFQY